MKKIEEYTDRELIEKACINSQVAAASSSFVKKFVVIVASIWLAILLVRFAVSLMGVF